MACLLGLVYACCFVYVVFVQRVPGYVVCLSGCVKTCGAHAGLCALERDGGNRGEAGNAECIEWCLFGLGL